MRLETRGKMSGKVSGKVSEKARESVKIKWEDPYFDEDKDYYPRNTIPVMMVYTESAGTMKYPFQGIGLHRIIAKSYDGVIYAHRKTYPVYMTKAMIDWIWRVGSINPKKWTVVGYGSPV